MYNIDTIRVTPDSRPFGPPPPMNAAVDESDNDATQILPISVYLSTGKRNYDSIVYRIKRIAYNIILRDIFYIFITSSWILILSAMCIAYLYT